MGPIYKYISPKAAHESPGDNFLSANEFGNVCLVTKKFGKSPFTDVASVLQVRQFTVDSEEAL